MRFEDRECNDTICEGRGGNCMTLSVADVPEVDAFSTCVSDRGLLFCRGGHRRGGRGRGGHRRRGSSSSSEEEESVEEASGDGNVAGSGDDMMMQVR